VQDDEMLCPSDPHYLSKLVEQLDTRDAIALSLQDHQLDVQQQQQQ
jgi:hypothetical protein